MTQDLHIGLRMSAQCEDWMMTFSDHCACTVLKGTGGGSLHVTV